MKQISMSIEIAVQVVEMVAEKLHLTNYNQALTYKVDDKDRIFNESH